MLDMFGGCGMDARGNVERDTQAGRRDAYDVVKRFMVDLDEGRVAPARVTDIRKEIYDVVARLERVRKMFPGTELGLCDDLGVLIKLLERRHGFLGKAALF